MQKQSFWHYFFFRHNESILPILLFYHWNLIQLKTNYPKYKKNKHRVFNKEFLMDFNKTYINEKNDSPYTQLNETNSSPDKSTFFPFFHLSINFIIKFMIFKKNGKFWFCTLLFHYHADADELLKGLNSLSVPISWCL